MPTQSILIVDDEEVMTQALTVLFQNAGYATDAVHSGQAALHYLVARRPDLMVLDVVMPDIDGYAVCRHVRQYMDYIPILMLTVKDQSWEKVLGLELGADVYVTKPFVYGELLAQVKALLRLATCRKNPAAAERPLTFGALTLWEQQCRVLVHDREIKLAPQEFKLLHFLMHHPQQVFGRTTLLHHVWGYEQTEDTRTVDVHIQRLREKLAPMQVIQTVRGFGYQLVEPHDGQ